MVFAPEKTTLNPDGSNLVEDFGESNINTQDIVFDSESVSLNELLSDSAQIVDKCQETIALQEQKINETVNGFRSVAFGFFKEKATAIYNSYQEKNPQLKKNKFISLIKEDYLQKSFPELLEKFSEDLLELFTLVIYQSSCLGWGQTHWQLFLETTANWPSKSIIALLKITKLELFLKALNYFKDEQIVPSVKDITSYKQQEAPTQIPLNERVSEPVKQLVLVKCEKLGLTPTKLEKYLREIEDHKREQLKNEGQLIEGMEISITGQELIEKFKILEKEKYNDTILKIVPKPRGKKKTQNEKDLENKLEIAERELEKQRNINETLQEQLNNINQFTSGKVEKCMEKFMELLIDQKVLAAESKEKMKYQLSMLLQEEDEASSLIAQ